MTPQEHYDKAEALIAKANELKSNQPIYWRDLFSDALSLAQVHATLANFKPDEPIGVSYDSWDEPYA